MYSIKKVLPYSEKKNVPFKSGISFEENYIRIKKLN